MTRRKKRRNTKPRPEHTIQQILAWADAHHQRTGRWPTKVSGLVVGGFGDMWNAVHLALLRGSRGLPGGSSLARLLAERRGVRNHLALARFRIRQILDWADVHVQARGAWPQRDSGPVLARAGEDWRNVDTALRMGCRGLPGGSSLAQLLALHRGVRNRKGLPPLPVKKIVACADAYHERTGRWPTRASGPIPEMQGETWNAVGAALHNGCRGFPGGSSLAQLLHRERGVRNRQALPPLRESQIVTWARHHRRRTGNWPTEDAGPIHGTRGEIWINVTAGLAMGFRGLPGGDSLARLLARRLGVRNGAALPPFRVRSILRWADAFHARTSRWPRADSGPIPESEGDTWTAVDDALRTGLRGLPGGSSLARLLTEERGVRNPRFPPKLNVKQILKWAKAHHRRTGRWPGHGAGPIPEAPGETWNAVGLALARGTRGLVEGESLCKLLRRTFGNA